MTAIPAAPGMHAIGILVLTGVALFLFTRERIPLESSSLFVLVVLVVGLELYPYPGLEVKQLFHGFGHEALIAVCALMICGQALVRTGALEPIGRSLARLWRDWPKLSFLLTLLVGAAASAFVNNTPIVVLMLPILINVSLRTKTAASGTLLPMGLATLIGGMSTTIGTSTNLLVVQVAADIGVEPFSMFDFAKPVLVAGGVAILYLWLVAPRLLPHRETPLQDTSPRVYTAQLHMDEESWAAGHTLAQIIDKTDGEMSVRRVIRRGGLFMATLPDVLVQPGDKLVIIDTPPRLREYEQILGGQLMSEQAPSDSQPQDQPEQDPFSARNQKIAEVAVVAGSALDGLRLADARLSSKYKLTLLAVHRSGAVAKIRGPAFRDMVFRSGDILLVQGAASDIERVKRSGELLVLDGSADLPHSRKAPLALGIMATVVVLAAFGILPIAVSALAGVMVLLASGCLDWKDTTRALSAQVVLIIVASLALGVSLMATGGADYLAQLFIAATFGMPGWFVLSALMLSMAIITNVVSNNAAAVIGTPIAISIAQRLGLPMEPFVLAVLFGANMSFATPMAYKTNLLVMNAGGYKFGDFVRVGVPLTALLWVVLSAVLAFSYQL